MLRPQALRISSSMLDYHVLATSDGFETLAGIAERELEKQARFLGGLDADLETVSGVEAHKEFLSLSVRRAVETDDKRSRSTLSNYVSRVRMQQVASSCLKTHGELKTHFEDVQEAIAQLSRGGDEVGHTVGDNWWVQSMRCDTIARRWTSVRRGSGVCLIIHTFHIPSH